MKKIILGIITLFLVTVNTTVFADNGKVNIDIIEFNQQSVEKNTITGNFEIQNTTDNYSSELFYTLSLVPKEFIDENTRLYSSSVDLSESAPHKFSLAAKEKKYIAFEYNVPEHLYKEDCMLVLRFMDRTSTFMKTSGIGIFSLGKSEGFIIPSNYKEAHYWGIEGYEGALTGPYFELGKAPIGYINLKSTFNKQVTVTPEFTVYKRDKTYLDAPYVITKGKAISFNANEIKKTEVTFPILDEPDSYLVKVVLKDGDQLPVSHEYWFRYVVKGINAKILNASTTYLEDSKSLDINLSYVGSADGSTVSDAEINVIATSSKDGKEIMNYSEKIELTPSTFKITKNLPLEASGEEIKIFIAIKYNGEILDSRDLTIEPKGTSKPEDVNLFLDVEGTKCEEAVKMLNSLGIISGYPDGSYRPENNITRAEFTTIALKMKGIKIEPTGSNAFTDVSDKHWAKDIINTAYNNGIINGYGDGLFKPDNNVTYSEALTILLNVGGYKDTVKGMSESWPMNYISTASRFGITGDVEFNSYGDMATRGNIAIMTLKMYWLRRV